MDIISFENAINGLIEEYGPDAPARFHISGLPIHIPEQCGQPCAIGWSIPDDTADPYVVFHVHAGEGNSLTLQSLSSAAGDAAFESGGGTVWLNLTGDAGQPFADDCLDSIAICVKDGLGQEHVNWL